MLAGAELVLTDVLTTIPWGLNPQQEGIQVRNLGIEAEHSFLSLLMRDLPRNTWKKPWKPSMFGMFPIAQSQPWRKPPRPGP